MTFVAAEFPVITTGPLKVADRCDRCGAQAFVRTEHEASELLWCGHHFVEHEAKLAELGTKVVDERVKINQAPSPSATL